MRLDKMLSSLDVGTRKEVQKIVRLGRVNVNNQVVKDPAFSVQENDLIKVDNQTLNTCLKRTVMLHKPSGVLTAAFNKKQKTVMDLLPSVYQTLNCMPVGRLDKDTTGLLLLTTDGELCHRLISPKYGVKKVYVASVDTPLQKEDIEVFEKGISFKDFVSLPAKLEIVSDYVAKITVTEGKYHQVKRMLQHVGHQTLSLKRISFSIFELKDALKEGEMRELTEEENRALYRSVQMEY